MKSNLALFNRFKISANGLEDLSFILYLCIPLITSVITIVVPSIAVSLAIIIAYSPLLLSHLVRRKRVALDFLLLFFFIVLFILITYLIHPNYVEWYTRKTYGIWDYVLRPDNGLYIFLFIRVINDPKRIIKSARCAGWLMLLYYGLKAFSALQRGYWIDTSNKGYEIHMSYNLGLGYHVLLFVLLFLYCALEYKDRISWLAAGCGIIIIAIAGSRGPFLCVLIFFAVYLGVKLIDSSKRILYLFLFVLIAFFIWLMLPYLLNAIDSLLNSLNIHSRIINKLVDGTISDDSRRYIIWDATIQMIIKNPLGYGALGSRHVISELIYAGYPHNVFLELLVDFGLFFGIVIILFMLVAFFRIIFMKDNSEWKGLFTVFFANSCQLLISLTYWHSVALWSVLAVGMCIKSSRKRKESQNVKYQN